ncbi:MAG: PilZ domain-containing protein [Acidobacteria bacterium]|nr:PilZ domain-containing protein [Acidobacteriota bacterium]
MELLDFRPRIRDISQGGLFIEDLRPLPAGRMLRLLLRLNPDSRAITVWGMVRRVEEGKGMGVEFVQISPADRALVRDFLQAQTRNEGETEGDLDL